MYDYEKYNIKVEQKYVPADGSKNTLLVVDVDLYADCGDIVVYDYDQDKLRRIDAFKLSMVRYVLI